MTDLYERLEQVGFSPEYVRAHILPDWWDDELASDLESRRLAEMAIGRTLKLPLSVLVDRERVLQLDPGQGVRFKKWSTAEEAKLLPTVVVARRACELLLSCAKLKPAQLEGQSAKSLRDGILLKEPYVTLTPIVKLSWDLGIPILHLKNLPTGARRVDGLALTVQGRPCIVLLSQKPSPALLAWPAAHEMGHIASGHLQGGDRIDVKLDLSAESPEEREANDFAATLIYGGLYRFNSQELIPPDSLARQAQERGPVHRIHPACIITNYGFNMGTKEAWEAANAALKLSGLARGGGDAVREFMVENLDRNRLTETDRHFFDSVTGLSE